VFWEENDFFRGLGVLAPYSRKLFDDLLSEKLPLMLDLSD
jgi:hypothetical protein